MSPEKFGLFGCDELGLRSDIIPNVQTVQGQGDIFTDVGHNAKGEREQANASDYARRSP